MRADHDQIRLIAYGGIDEWFGRTAVAACDPDRNRPFPGAQRTEPILQIAVEDGVQLRFARHRVAEATRLAKHPVDVHYGHFDRSYPLQLHHPAQCVLSGVGEVVSDGDPQWSLLLRPGNEWSSGAHDENGALRDLRSAICNAAKAPPGCASPAQGTGDDESGVDRARVLDDCFIGVAGE